VLPTISQVLFYLRRSTALAGLEMAGTLNQAKTAAGPELINATLIITIILIVAFTGLYIHAWQKKTRFTSCLI
jgi:hypothetical protein